MKNMFKISAAALVIAAAAFTGCKKYEEGPSLSLRSKTARVANTWKIDEITVNGTAQTLNSMITDARMEFTKDGDFKQTYLTQTVTGTWEFVNDKEDIKTTVGTDLDTLHIIKLKNAEMWIEDKSGVDVTVTKLVSAE